MSQKNNHRMRATDGRAQPQRAAAFTLIELLVSLSILLILAALTFRMISSIFDSDRIRTAARSLQSYLAGARDRAIYAGQPRGVRFLLNQNDLTTVSSFVYIGAPTTFTDGTQITINPLDVNKRTFVSVPSAWLALANRGLLVDGGAITLGGIKYTMAQISGVWNLTKPYAATVGVPVSYALQLAPSILPNEEPRNLPTNIVVDLDNSILPQSWTPSAPLDILFSPQGTVIGSPATAGRIHFVLSDVADIVNDVPINGLSQQLRLNAPWQPGQSYAVGNVIVPTPSSYVAFRCTGAGTSGASISFPSDPTLPAPADNGVVWQTFAKKTNLFVSLATQTGRITTHPVDVSTPLSSGLGYDTFRFAEVGEVTQ
jgi:prepilin-type N-terminal cleavage/methylation domain-containing protein